MANEPTPIELGKDEDNKELDNIDGNDEGPEDEDIEEDEDVEDVEELDEDEDVDVPVIEEDVVEVEDYEEPLVAGADDEDDNDEEDDDEEDDDDEDDDDEEDETYIDPSLGEDIDLYNEYDEYMDPNYLQKFS